MSLISLLSVVVLIFQKSVLRNYIFVFISVAVGALLGDAFIHLIPEALESSPNTSLTSVLIIVGILIFFMLEKFFHWHHHGQDTEKNNLHPLGKLILLSDGMHNIIDGIIIGASYMVSIPTGIATTMAVILHEIPQEVGDFAVLLHSGYTKRRALWLNFMSALTAILGAIIFFMLDEAAGSVVTWLLPIAAGGFIYIAVADLIPELHKTKEVKYSLLQLAAVIAGILIMIGLAFLE